MRYLTRLWCFFADHRPYRLFPGVDACMRCGGLHRDGLDRWRY